MDRNPPQWHRTSHYPSRISGDSIDLHWIQVHENINGERVGAQTGAIDAHPSGVVSRQGVHGNLIQKYEPSHPQAPSPHFQWAAVKLL